MALKFNSVESASPPASGAPDNSEAQAYLSARDAGQIPALARAAVESFILERGVIKPARASHTPLLTRPAACFVCIKTLGRQLRGCIGAVEPEQPSLAEEVINNAIKAATRDRRFKPVAADELPSLSYSVDVLGSLEPAAFEDLDPSIFGVVVTNRTGSRRGLLLPALDGIRTADEQVGVAARKAGIPAGEPLKLYRFRTQRFGEPT
ncbi:MAG TPA: AmmeMemoRadiSam system protein A [Pyrinomonadaceae bacterium]|jgi:AmmeMemoRadiSam system protein A